MGPGGTMVIQGSGSQALVPVDRSGRFERLHPRLGDFGDPQLSPDGRRLAVRLDNNIWLLDRTQGTLTRLSFDGSASRPVWSMDAHRVAYTRHIGRHVDARFISPDGNTKADSLLALPKLEIWEVLFTPNGRSMLVRTVGGPGGQDVWLTSLDSLAQSDGNYVSDGTHAVYDVTPDGGHFVMVRRIQAGSYMAVTLNRFGSLPAKGGSRSR